MSRWIWGALGFFTCIAFLVSFVLDGDWVKFFVVLGGAALWIAIDEWRERRYG
jgi:hypothetical protein